MSDCPDTDLPKNFYFNGELMPKWGAWWGAAGIADLLQPSKDACEDVSDRDIFIIYCKIDHEGVVESAAPEIFLFAIQEVLYLLLHNRDKVLATIAKQFPAASEMFEGMIEAGFQMRQLAMERGSAFWTSGDEKDRLELLEALRRSQLPADSADYRPPPHIARMRSHLRIHHQHQVSKLHALAQTGQFSKDLRRRLHSIEAP